MTSQPHVNLFGSYHSEKFQEYDISCQRLDERVRYSIDQFYVALECCNIDPSVGSFRDGSQSNYRPIGPSSVKQVLDKPIVR